MATQLVPENLKTQTAALPANYERTCAMIAECAAVDECQGWANKAAALAAYARQAEDDRLQRHAMRIQSRAIRRAGELLTEMRAQGVRTDLTEPRDGDDRKSGDQLPEGAHRKLHDEPLAGALPKSATEAARAAGMSEHQHRTAVRVANLPRDEFEAAVESATPPTVTALAEMGKRAAPGGAGSPGFQEQMQFMGHARRLAEFAAAHDPAFVGAAVADYNRRELRGYVARCRRFLAALAPTLREKNDGL